MKRYSRNALLFLVGPFLVVAARSQQVLDVAQQAYDKGDYQKAVSVLKEAAPKDPNGDMQLLLTKSYMELKKYDEAVTSGEKAVAINPQSSVYHQWLGEAY